MMINLRSSSLPCKHSSVHLDQMVATESSDDLFIGQDKKPKGSPSCTARPYAPHLLGVDCPYGHDLDLPQEVDSMTAAQALYRCRM